MADEETKVVLNGLKDFQRETVKRVIELFDNGTTRVLVSDEVGLGKTIVAKGVLAEMHASDSGKGLKVVYVCSNGAIAEQNLRKLKISKSVRVESSHSSRLSMQHLKIFEQEHISSKEENSVSLIPLTPGTSFSMYSNAGTIYERMLMFEFLSRIPSFKPYLSSLETAMRHRAKNSDVRYKYEVENCNSKTNGAYVDYMIQKVREKLIQKRDGEPAYLIQLIDYCREIENNPEGYRYNNLLIKKLRMMFAEISIDKLNPDLIILDEFQRFKKLLEEDENDKSDVGMLAAKFFGNPNSKMLLLSATPYKMYSTMEELEEEPGEQHYDEFEKLIKVLKNDSAKSRKFKDVWLEYTNSISKLSKGNIAEIAEIKIKAEDELYSNICRTERASAPEMADIIDDTSVGTGVHISTEDIKSFIKMQELVSSTGIASNTPVDYIKSTPYLLSYMRDYKLKEKIETYFKANPDKLKIAKGDLLWINKNKIRNYKELKYSNARLEYVSSKIFEKDAYKLLWVPPTIPYYEFGETYRNSEGFTKTLIFSSWEMVPRMISTLLSYEAERKTIRKLNPPSKPKYFTNDRKRYPPQRMSFVKRDGRLSGMALFTLLYPSISLAELFNPKELLKKASEEGIVSIKALTKEISKKVKDKLAEIKYEISTDGISSTAWYYLAPLMMDEPEYVREWLSEGKQIAMYEDNDSSENDGKSDKEISNKRQDAFSAHLDELKHLYEMYTSGELKIRKRPDDLERVLVDMVLASPAICMYRTLLSYHDNHKDFIALPSQAAKVFITRMNTLDWTAVVEMTKDSKADETHWKSVLRYCKDGNLQAVFDEYGHIIADGTQGSLEKVQDIHRRFIESVNITTTTYPIETFNSFSSKVNISKEEQKAKDIRMRTNFAVAFTQGQNNDKSNDRRKIVRNAFNSPFRPFVLASTSIGQEGLDFHSYCRRIVHWNLPSNPIDLEQREGRINRYKSLAIRQNVAKMFKCTDFDVNVWEELFAKAKEDAADCSDLIPYWGLKKYDENLKIERIVPMYPYSQDGDKYDRMMNILSLYRLSLGQPRQEEFLNHIIKSDIDYDELKKLFINLSPYYKAKKDDE